jgi:hypothetical protein
MENNKKPEGNPFSCLWKKEKEGHLIITSKAERRNS